MKNLTSAFQDFRNYYRNEATELERSNIRALAGSVFLGSVGAVSLGVGLLGDNPYYLATGTVGISLCACLGTLSGIELSDRNLVRISEEEEDGK